MRDMLRYAGQLLFFTAVIAFVGYFSNRPVYHQFSKDQAQIKLGFAHGGARKIDCRKLTSKEIAKLPANKRRPNTCTRERIPLYVQLAVDGKVIYDEHLPATGLYHDGPARTYQKINVSTGLHSITVRLRDSKRVTGFDYETTHQVTLESLQNLAIDFKADAGGFLFR